MDGVVYAPFTPEQVQNLNGFQSKNYMHPFTCGNEECRRVHRLEDTTLYATEDGWRCRFCEYEQNWAHAFMADGSWKRYAEQMDEFWRRA